MRHLKPPNQIKCGRYFGKCAVHNYGIDLMFSTFSPHCQMMAQHPNTCVAAHLLLPLNIMISRQSAR